MDKLRQLEVFVAAADRMNFSGAARALGVSPAAVSAAIAALEASWGARLFDRTTRSVRLTDTGRALADRSRRILRELEKADTIASTASGQVHGNIKVSAPVSYGVRVLASLFADFLRHNPEVELDIDLSDRRVDLVGEGYDLAIRIGHQIAPGLVARRLAQQRLILCASPNYLARHGEPAVPDDLTRHSCLVFTPRLPSGKWTFTGPGGARRSVAVHGPMQSDNGEVLQQAARLGAGLTLTPHFLVDDALASGELIEVMPQWRSLSLGVYTVRIAGPRPSLRIGRLIEFLKASLAHPSTPLPRHRGEANG
ncbi:LysR family transcriptional regulator [Altererythrobacter sp. Root672]|uniref:LysR family transcriptional regulator n=1 Tax=Altererythrobacter sp. Root672 TaxID=1736584 RepID=UPI0006FECA97|nr:LysR family transcriptional regulator [Altererythrobacter sp. Root672]KRA84380.1 hypothetical protein ASD76_10490 [Altererythrobacter sp. Root672]